MRINTLWGTVKVETLLSYAIAAGALVIGVVLLGNEVGRHINAFEQWIGGLGPSAFVVFALLYVVLSSVFVPDTLLGIITGASFGLGWGLAVAASGSLGGAVLQYAMARSLLKPTINKALASRPALAATMVAVHKQEFRLQLLIRLTPVNRTLTNYVLGSVDVGLLRFLVACVGFLPHIFLEVYFGYAGRHLARMAGQPAHFAALHDLALFVGLVAAIIVIVIISKTARRAVEAATSAVAGQASPAKYEGDPDSPGAGRVR